jgi:hypothetical protein
MTDEKLVSDFLNRECELFYDMYSDSVVIKDKTRDENYSKKFFKIFLVEIFGNFKGLTDIFDNWFYENEKVLLIPINEFIKNTIIDFGQTNWVAKHKDYGTLDLNRLNKYFPNETKHQQVYFIRIFYQWYDNKVIEISEKMMEEF